MFQAPSGRNGAGIKMSVFQLAALFVLAGCVVGSLWAIYKAIQRLSEGVVIIRNELLKLNAKLESIEVAERDNPPNTKPYEPNPSLEAAIRALQSLKIDLEKPDRDKSE